MKTGEEDTLLEEPYQHSDVAASAAVQHEKGCGQMKKVYCLVAALFAVSAEYSAMGATITVEKPGLTYLKGTGDNVTTNSIYSGGIVLGDWTRETTNCAFRFFLPPPTVGTKSLSTLKVWVYGKRGTFGSLSQVYIGTDPSNHAGSIGNQEGWHLLATYTGTSARALLTSNGDAIGCRVDILLKLLGWDDFFDLK